MRTKHPESPRLLFYHMNSCAQYEVSMIWLLCLTFVCLYWLPLHIICTNICSNILSFIVINCDNAHLPVSPRKFALVLSYFMNSCVQCIYCWWLSVSFGLHVLFIFVCLCKLYTLTYKLLSPLFIVINHCLTSSEYMDLDNRRPAP